MTFFFSVSAPWSDPLCSGSDYIIRDFIQLHSLQAHIRQSVVGTATVPEVTTGGEEGRNPACTFR